MALFDSGTVIECSGPCTLTMWSLLKGGLKIEGYVYIENVCVVSLMAGLKMEGSL